MLKSAEDALTLVRCKPQLENYSGPYFKTDLTKMQQSNIKKLREDR